MVETFNIINAHSLNIGFSIAEADIVAKSLKGLADEYQNREKANEVFASTYPKNVSRVFLESQLSKFIRVVRNRSFLPDAYETEEELGWSPDEYKIMLRMGEITQKEAQEYFKEREEYIKTSRPERELGVLRLLEVGDFYPILASKVYRPIVRIQNPNPGPKRLIYTPTGGMPVYHKKRKRR